MTAQRPSSHRAARRPLAESRLFPDRRRSRLAATPLALGVLATAVTLAPADEAESEVAPGATPASAAAPVGAAFADAHPEHVFVRFRQDATAADRLGVHAAAGALEKLREFRWVDGLVLMRVAPGRVGEAIARYQADPNVLYAEPDGYVHPTSPPDDPFFPLLWGLDNTGQDVSGPGVPDADIDAPEAWSIWTGDPEFRVAVLDTGVNYNHPDLAANIWTNPGEILNGIDDDGNGYVDDLHGIDTIGSDSDPLDAGDHGTHCAGTIGAVGDNGLGVVGVNWRCRLVPIRTIGSGTWSDTVEAMEYVLDQGITVSSNSYTGGGIIPQPMYEVIQASQEIGHIFVVAAGNDGSNIDIYPTWPASMNLPNIICVAGTNNIDGLYPSSNFGAFSVDVGAPAVDVYSTAGAMGYDYRTGTSMACPHVAGVVALLWSRNPQLSWQQVIEIVKSTARPLAALEGITATGGMVNADAALRAVDPADLNVDGVIDAADLGILLAHWGEAGIGDLNHDGTIDGVDVGALLASWSV